MATNIPPHNLREVIDGVIAAIEQRGQSSRTPQGRPRAVPGPDFPTGGFIVGRTGIFQAYTTGRGAITAPRARQHRGIEEGRQDIAGRDPRFRIR